MEIIARKKEKQLLDTAYTSDQSELIALYGRRRVGKTFLIRNFFLEKDCTYFELVGQKNENGEIATVSQQLSNFQYAWKKAFGEHIAKPKHWGKAFYLLKNKVDDISVTERKIVLFFDELPWLCSPNSRFYENFDQAWNACFERAGNIKVVVCGSASTWILKRIIYSKAGLSRRITRKIHLHPFTLSETREYLHCKHFDLSMESVAEIFMILGGIPYYLDFLSPQKSIYQNIEDECFQLDGNLFGEYDIVFDSLFKNSEAYKRVLEIVAEKRQGCTQQEIHHKLNNTRSTPNGTLVKILKNLYECDFIQKRTPFFNEKKGTLYFVCDEFTVFYQKWIKNAPLAKETKDSVYWQSIVNSQQYRIWLGFCFEMLCYKHQSLIKIALGLHKIVAIPGIFYAYNKKTKKRSAQVDLLFDRADKTITLCEIKYHQGEYKITQKDLQSMRNKKEDLRNFLTAKKTYRNMNVAFITVYGVQKNSCFNELQPEVVVLNDLFRKI